MSIFKVNPIFKEARIKALSQSLNVRDVEQILQKMIAEAREQEQEFRFVLAFFKKCPKTFFFNLLIFFIFREKLNNLNSDEQSLDNKIERRQREYDQLQKRLAKLQVRLECLTLELKRRIS